MRRVTRGTWATGDIDRELFFLSARHRARLARMDPRPQNLLWIAGTAYARLETAKPQERSDLYLSLAVLYFAAGRKPEARRWFRGHRNLAPPSELEALSIKALNRLNKEILALSRGKRRQK